jgi:hypothetical protein
MKALISPCADRKPLPTRKQKRCSNSACGTQFTPQRLGQKVCSPACALVMAPANQDKARKSLAQVERKDIKARKEKLKSRADHLREAQQAFNEFIRWRDQLAGHACISSGRPLDWSGNMTDCGHYRSVGSSPHLRFDERNAHAQSKHDNQFLSGNVVAYRIGLIARIGLAAVEALESDQSVKKYTVDDLKAIKAHYRALTREIKRQAA